MPLKELLKKYGFSGVLSSITLHGYYLTVKGEMINKQKEKEILEKTINQEKDSKDIIEQATQSKVWIEEREGLQNTYNTTVNPETKTILNSRIQELTEKIKNANTKILETARKSDIIGFFSNIIDNYYSWLATLSSDKIVAIFNIIVDSVLLVNLFTVISLLMGEHLIDFFKLEVKYPNLTKLIRLKNKVNRYYKTMYLVLYLLFLAFGILGNILMFFMEHLI